MDNSKKPEAPAPEQTPEMETPEQEQARRRCRSLRRLRFETGLVVLGVSMGAMVILVLMDVVFSMHTDAERTLIENAFEAFKLIAVTVLGYIFGANQARPDEDE